MKRRYKKVITLNRKHARRHGVEANCIHCGLGYDRRKLKKHGLLTQLVRELGS